MARRSRAWGRPRPPLEVSRGLLEAPRGPLSGPSPTHGARCSSGDLPPAPRGRLASESGGVDHRRLRPAPPPPPQKAHTALILFSCLLRWLSEDCPCGNPHVPCRVEPCPQAPGAARAPAEWSSRPRRAPESWQGWKGGRGGGGPVGLAAPHRVQCDAAGGRGPPRQRGSSLEGGVGGRGRVPARHSTTWCGSPYSTRLRLVRSHSGPRGCDWSVSLSLEVPGDSSGRERQELVTPEAPGAGTGASPGPAAERWGQAASLCSALWSGRCCSSLTAGATEAGGGTTQDRARPTPRPAPHSTRPSTECSKNPEASTGSGPFLPPASGHHWPQGGPAAPAVLSFPSGGRQRHGAAVVASLAGREAACPPLR